MKLPLAQKEGKVVFLQSGEKDDAFEKGVFIDEGDRVLVLTLTARNQAAFDGFLPAFDDFAKSYESSIVLGPRVG